MTVIFMMAVVAFWLFSIYLIAQGESSGLFIGLGLAVVVALYALLADHQSLLVGAIAFGAAYLVSLYEHIRRGKRLDNDS